jgi:catechol 2,3-dioxygenase-like lactoylglutathione lyase family enzyme
MSIELNHTVVRARDKNAAAKFLAGILGLPVGEAEGVFATIQLSNGVTLDYADSEEVTSQHYAFLVGDDEFDAAFDRIRTAGVEYYADPFHQRRGEINHLFGGRGFYFADADGNNMELLTQVHDVS